ncbi:MAG: oxidoreductase [Catenulispora sp. 13_1_20CM_3_70_7]|nr:ferredoxin reductase [Catenulisporales bacterium]OLE23216.1 MAG: oxidoreductase [Catenulispora sp. 13_1_20CM_3_70_7]
MARAAISGRLGERLRWRVATLVGQRDETPGARTLVFDVPGWPGHLAGQHVDLRLTADDGYSTQRSYSIASAPDGEAVELTVQRIGDGEVSPYLADDLVAGDLLEMRGPVGGWFVWRPEQTEPVLLVAGGSGIVPLMAMIRARRQSAAEAPFRLLYSVRSPADLIYRAELQEPDPALETTFLFTRETPADWRRPAGRVTQSDLAAVAWPPPTGATIYVCGPTGFVENAADLLVGLGHDPERIRTERFGPTGG